MMASTRRYFACTTCTRRQSYAPANERGGITEVEAIRFGWAAVTKPTGWQCPFCSGNEDKLLIFEPRDERHQDLGYEHELGED